MPASPLRKSRSTSVPLGIGSPSMLSSAKVTRPSGEMSFAADSLDQESTICDRLCSIDELQRLDDDPAQMLEYLSYFELCDGAALPGRSVVAVIVRLASIDLFNDGSSSK